MAKSISNYIANYLQVEHEYLNFSQLDLSRPPDMHCPVLPQANLNFWSKSCLAKTCSSDGACNPNGTNSIRLKKICDEGNNIRKLNGIMPLEIIVKQEDNKPDLCKQCGKIAMKDPKVAKDLGMKGIYCHECVNYERKRQRKIAIAEEQKIKMAAKLKKEIEEKQAKLMALES